MLKLLFYISGIAAFIYLLIEVVADHSRKATLTEEFINITTDVCLPAMKMNGQVSTQEFRTQIQSVLPESYSINDDKVKTLDGVTCGQFRIKKQGSSISTTICQDAFKNMKCSMGLSTKPYSLNELDYIAAIPDFKHWTQGKPNAHRKVGEFKTPFSRYLCRQTHTNNAANAATFMQMRSLHNVGVTVYESRCEQLGKVIQ